MKRYLLMTGLFMLFLLSVAFVDNVFAEFGGGKRPGVVPEPVSALLFLAGGGAMGGLYYLRSKLFNRKK